MRHGLTGGRDVVGVIRVRDGLLVALDLARDLGELLLGELVAQHEGLAVGRLQRRVPLELIDLGERRGIVDLRHVAEVLQLRRVHQREREERRHRDDRAPEDERRAPAARALAPVGDRAEERQHKQRQNVVQRHDHAGQRLRHAEFVRQNQGNRVVIRLPEGADQEKREAHQYGALVVQFHTLPPLPVRDGLIV